ncbi:hypothetical protein IGK38_003080, partial [Enterococcus pernyi]
MARSNKYSKEFRKLVIQELRVESTKFG